MNRQFSREIHQIPQCLERFCDNGKNPFHSACRKWYLDNQSPGKLYLFL